MRTVYRWWATIVLLGIVVQVGFAGFGYLVVIGGLVLLMIALAGRVGKRRILQTLGVFGLLIVQVLLAWIGFGVPAVGALHPINALAIFAFTGYLVGTEWRMKRATPVA